MTRAQRSIGGLIAATVLAAVLAVPANAGVDFVKTRLTIHPAAIGPEGAAAFKGRVRADQGFCRKHRTVKLMFRRPGKDRLVGKDRSNRRGRWRVNGEGPLRGRYYAKAPRKLRIISGEGIDCRRGVSRTVEVG